MPDEQKDEETIFRQMDVIVQKYAETGNGMWANEDPEFIELFNQLKKVRKKNKEEATQ